MLRAVEKSKRKDLLGLQRRVSKQEANIPEEAERHRTRPNINQKVNLKSGSPCDLGLTERVSTTRFLVLNPV